MTRVDAALGVHLIADFGGVDAAWLQDCARVESLLREAASIAGATPIFSKFHHFGGAGGITGVVLLQESHISIHTWPEHDFAAVDVFMCGACRPERAIEHIRRAFRAERFSLTNAARGVELGVVQPDDSR